VSGTGSTSILVVDDEPAIRRALRLVLAANGFRVGDAATGAEALDRLAATSYDLLLLDLVLPDMPGIDVCQQVRKWSRMPIIVLSVLGDEPMKVEALQAGADDYVTKPFSTPELVARVQSAVRRMAWASESQTVVHTQCGEVVVDLEQRSVTRAGDEIHLTPIEYEILAFLARNAGRVIANEQLLRAVMGVGYEDASGALRVHILNLRRKLEPAPSRPCIIVTEPGVGYRLIV
jgi:two-component system KDP operon response regulator KdpE